MGLIINPYIMGPTVILPTPLSGTWANYRAMSYTSNSDGDTVGAWADESGNARDATVSNVVKYKTAQLNSWPALTFDPTDSAGGYFSLPSMAALTSGTAYYILKVAAVPAADSKGGLHVIGSSGSTDEYPYTDSLVYDSWGTTAQTPFSATGKGLTSYHCMQVEVDSVSKLYRINGVPWKDVTSPTVGFSSAPKIGQNISAQEFRGRIVEVIIFSSRRSDNNRINTDQAYITSTYGLTFPALGSGQITWSAKVNVSESVTGTIVSTAGGWTAGAFSNETTPTIDFEVHNATQSRIIGMSLTNPDASYANIKYGFLIQTGNLYAAESGSFPSLGGVAYGDILQLEHSGTTMIYRKNGSTLRTATSVPAGDYFCDVAIEDSGSSLGPVRYH